MQQGLDGYRREQAMAEAIRQQRAAFKEERETLLQERQRLTQEAEALKAQRGALLQREEILRRAGAGGLGQAQAAVQRERAQLAQERTRLTEELAEERRGLARERERLQRLAEGLTERRGTAPEREVPRRSAVELAAERRAASRRLAGLGDSDVVPSAADPQARTPAKSAVRAEADLVKELRAELAAAEQRLARQVAEFQNFRARMETQEKARASQGLAKLAQLLLPIVDDFRRAVAGSGEQVGQVLAPLQRKLLAVLESDLKARAMSSAIGQPFDPRLQEAVTTTPSDAPADTVVDVLEEGFLSADGEVLRPARVVVSSGRAG